MIEVASTQTVGAEAAGVETLMRLDEVSQVFATKRGDVPAVSEVSLDLRAGQVTCLVGESGSGKTTVARIAAGLNRASSGRVMFDGTDLATLGRRQRDAYRRAVQYVHQDPYASLNPTRTIEGMLTAPLRKNRIARSRRAAHDRAAELLTQVGLTPAGAYLSKYPHQLSGGQRQRASVARALTMNPRLIIADEATSMLDVSIRISMLNMLGRLRDELDVGFLFITHDLALARYFASAGHIAVMYLGRIVEQGPTESVINNPRHPYTRALLEAVPEPDPYLTRNKRGAGLRAADIPSLLAIPPGCAFHPRCPMYQSGTCDATRPQLIPVTDDDRTGRGASHDGSADHAAACFRIDSVRTEMPITTGTDNRTGEPRQASNLDTAIGSGHDQP